MTSFDMPSQSCMLVWHELGERSEPPRAKEVKAHLVYKGGVEGVRKVKVRAQAVGRSLECLELRCIRAAEHAQHRRVVRLLELRHLDATRDNVIPLMTCNGSRGC